jgi:hypothetical protein
MKISPLQHMKPLECPRASIIAPDLSSCLYSPTQSLFSFQYPQPYLHVLARYYPASRSQIQLPEPQYMLLDHPDSPSPVSSRASHVSEPLAQRPLAGLYSSIQNLELPSNVLHIGTICSLPLSQLSAGCCRERQ